MEEIFKVLGDENRLRILNILMNGDCCVSEIELILSINQSNTSRHLSRLRDLGLVKSDKRAQWIYYSISKEFIELNEFLFMYLEKNFLSGIFKEDFKRFKIYKENNFTCSCIREDRDKINKVLNSGGII